MTTCPFCRGQALTPHSPQECLSHTKVRLRDMTDRRDALQVSVDNLKRAKEQQRSRLEAKVEASRLLIVELRRELVLERKAARYTIAELRRISTTVAGMLSLENKP